METSLLVPSNMTPEKLFAPQGLEPVLNSIKQKVDDFLETANAETEEGRKEIAAFARTVTRSKTFIEKGRVALVSDKKALLKLIDQEGKRSRDFLTIEAARARKPLTDYEAAEALRHQERVRIIQLNKMYDEALILDALFVREREVRRKEEAFAKLEEEKYQEEEAEAAEKARLELLAQAKKDQEERDERIRVAAAEKAAAEAQAKIDAAEERAKVVEELAEAARIKALKKAEADKKAAVALAEAQAAERVRIAKEAEDKRLAIEKAEAEKKAADKRHRATINKEIVAAFAKELDLVASEVHDIIEVIAAGKIPYVSINYEVFK